MPWPPSASATSRCRWAASECGGRSRRPGTGPGKPRRLFRRPFSNEGDWSRMRTADRRRGATLRMPQIAALAPAVAAGVACAGCGSSGGGTVTLNWYVFPEPSGSFASAASACSKASGGKYRIGINFLSTSSDEQRVSLVRRLAANDSSIDILAMDVDWTAEFAEVKWIRPVPAVLAAQETKGLLPGPIDTATWNNQLYAG